MIGPARAQRARGHASIQRVSVILGALDKIVVDPVESSPFILDLIDLASKHEMHMFTNGEVVKAMDEARKVGWQARTESNENLYRLVLTEPEDMAAQARKEGIRL